MIRFETKPDPQPAGKKATNVVTDKSPELALEKPATPAKGVTGRETRKTD